MQAAGVPRSITARECLAAANQSPSAACLKRIAVIYRAWATDADATIVAALIEKRTPDFKGK